MKPQINKILYATDLSKNSAHAFYFASDLAKKENARIVFLHCMGMTSPAAYLAAGFTDVPSLLKSAKEVEARKDVLEIKRRLTEFGRQVGSKMASSESVSEIVVTEGFPVEEILGTAEAKACDVIVMGTHEKGWLRETFLGSVARSVLERSRKPVLVVPLSSDKADIDWNAA